MRFWIVEKFVSVPPSQRWLTKIRAGALGLFANDVLRLLLGADEQNDFALARHVLDDFVGFAQLLHGEREVDDVDAVALLKDERLHLRIPATGLVTELDACLKQLAHGDNGHEKSPFWLPAASHPGGAVVSWNHRRPASMPGEMTTGQV